MADDLFRALEMFNQGATQLATGRAVRNASEQAQQINLMEEDEFKKRQAFTQLGQGLAAQLSSYGASPSQVQQMSANFMPQQMNSPQDFFAASQTATSPNAQKQYAQAGQGMQAQIAAAPMTTQQKDQAKIQRMQLLNERMALQAASGGKIPKDIDIVAEEDKQMITDLGKANAVKMSISNGMRSFLNEFDKKESQADKIAFAKMALPKVINSVAGGLDAVGTEEYKRIMNLLEFAPMGNLFSGDPMRTPGRDVEGFRNEVGSVLNGMQTTVEQNYSTIKDTYNKYGIDRPVPKFVNPPDADKTKQVDLAKTSSDIDSITQKINSNQINDADRLKAIDLLQRLKAKKEKLSKRNQ